MTVYTGQILMNRTLAEVVYTTVDTYTCEDCNAHPPHPPTQGHKYGPRPDAIISQTATFTDVMPGSIHGGIIMNIVLKVHNTSEVTRHDQPLDMPQGGAMGPNHQMPTGGADPHDMGLDAMPPSQDGQLGGSGDQAGAPEVGMGARPGAQTESAPDAQEAMAPMQPGGDESKAGGPADAMQGGDPKDGSGMPQGRANGPSQGGVAPAAAGPQQGGGRPGEATGMP